MHRHNSKEIKLFVEVLELYSNLSQKPLIVSSSYADVIKKVLGDYEDNFECIYGYESGHKLDILRNLTEKYQFIYVTDTYRDIIICKSLGIPVIATCWGYDSLERMEVEKPDYIVKNYNELNSILTKLNFLK
jgi:phosphoglycolate phosphatase-like HAD superfamily hydrolase